MRSFLILAGLLVALVCMADGEKMLAKDGTPLPDGVARIVKWEASQARQRKEFTILATDKDVRRHVSDMPQDGSYRMTGAEHSFTIWFVGTIGNKAKYMYHDTSYAAPGEKAVVIE